MHPIPFACRRVQVLVVFGNTARNLSCVISTGVPIGVVPVETFNSQPSVGRMSIIMRSSKRGVSSTNAWTKLQAVRYLGDMLPYKVLFLNRVYVGNEFVSNAHADTIISANGLKRTSMRATV